MAKKQNYSHAKADARKALKQKEADQRQAKYDSLTVDQKIKQIHSRPGKSEKELNRILLSVAKGEHSKAVSVPVTAPVTESKPKKKYQKIKKS